MQAAKDDENSTSETVGADDAGGSSVDCQPKAADMPPTVRYNPYDPRTNGVLPRPVPRHYECSFCLDPVFPRSDDKVSFNCCHRLYHVKCFVESAWSDLIVTMPKRKNVKCPECSKPPRSRQVALKIRRTIVVDGSSSDDDAMETMESKMSPEEIAKAEMRRDFFGSEDDDEGDAGEGTGDRWERAKLAMKSKGLMGAKTALQELRKPKVRCDFRWLIDNKITLDELLNSCKLEDIFKNKGVRTWKRLKQLGFRQDHLTILSKNGQIADLVRLYKVNARTLRKEMDVTLTSLPDLQFSARTMALLGFDTHELCIMRFTKDHIKRFRGIPMGEWINELGMSQLHLLLLKIKQKDFEGTAYLGQSWSVKGLCELLNLNFQTMRRLRLDPRQTGGGRRSRRGGSYHPRHQQQRPAYTQREPPQQRGHPASRRYNNNMPRRPYYNSGDPMY